MVHVEGIWVLWPSSTFQLINQGFSIFPPIFPLQVDRFWDQQLPTRLALAQPAQTVHASTLWGWWCWIVRRRHHFLGRFDGLDGLVFGGRSCNSGWRCSIGRRTRWLLLQRLSKKGHLLIHLCIRLPGRYQMKGIQYGVYNFLVGTRTCKSTNALKPHMSGTHCTCTLVPIDTLRSSSMTLAWSASGCFPLTLFVATGLGDPCPGLRGCFSANFGAGLLVALAGLALDLADVLALAFAEAGLAAANSSSVASWWNAPPKVFFNQWS